MIKDRLKEIDDWIFKHPYQELYWTKEMQFLRSLVTAYRNVAIKNIVSGLETTKINISQVYIFVDEDAEAELSRLAAEKGKL